MSRLVHTRPIVASFAGWLAEDGRVVSVGRRSEYMPTNIKVHPLSELPIYLFFDKTNPSKQSKNTNWSFLEANPVVVYSNPKYFHPQRHLFLSKTIENVSHFGELSLYLPPFTVFHSSIRQLHKATKLATAVYKFGPIENNNIFSPLRRILSICEYTSSMLILSCKSLIIPKILITPFRVA